MKFLNHPMTAPFLIACLMQAPSASAVVIGQTDNFEDGTTQGWQVGLGFGAAHPAPPVNVADGGPLGAGDNYLKLTSFGGGGAGNRLTVINPGQWAGNYAASGVSKIAMDLNNLGSTDLTIRVYLENPKGAPPEDEAVSGAFLLPNGSGWTHAEFAIDSSSLTVLTGDVTRLLSDVTAFRIFHGPEAEFPGPAVAATLGVDNVTAVPVPSAFFLFGLGLAGLMARLKKVI